MRIASLPSRLPPRPIDATRRFTSRVRGPAIGAGLALLVVAGCTELGIDPTTRPDVSGGWSGSYVIGGSSLNASFTFAGVGTEGSGTATVQSLLAGASFDWAYDQSGRVVVIIATGCEDWLGRLTPGITGQTLQGSLQVSRDACPTGENETGQLNLQR